MKENLKKFPYKPTVSQKISDVQRQKRLAFCHRPVTMEEEENFKLKKIIFSDKSHVYLDDVLKRQNNEVGWRQDQSFNHQRPLNS